MNKFFLIIISLCFYLATYSQPGIIPEEDYVFLLEKNANYKIGDVTYYKTYNGKINISSMPVIDVGAFARFDNPRYYFDRNYIQLVKIYRFNIAEDKFSIHLTNENDEDIYVYIYTAELSKEIIFDWYFINTILLNSYNFKKGTYLIGLFEEYIEKNKISRIDSMKNKIISSRCNIETSILPMDTCINKFINETDLFDGYYKLTYDLEFKFPRIQRGDKLYICLLEIKGKTIETSNISNIPISPEMLENYYKNKNIPRPKAVKKILSVFMPEIEKVLLMLRESLDNDKTLQHEIAHTLGLPHTFQTGLNGIHTFYECHTENIMDYYTNIPNSIPDKISFWKWQIEKMKQDSDLISLP